MITQKKLKTLLIPGKSDTNLWLWNIPFQLKPWLSLLMLNELRVKKVVILIYHCNSLKQIQNWNPKNYPLQLINQVLEVR